MTQINQSQKTGLILFRKEIYKISVKDYKPRLSVKMQREIFDTSRQASMAAKSAGHTITLYCITPSRQKSRKPGHTLELYIQPIQTEEQQKFAQYQDTLSAIQEL